MRHKIRFAQHQQHKNQSTAAAENSLKKFTKKAAKAASAPQQDTTRATPLPNCMNISHYEFQINTPQVDERERVNSEQQTAASRRAQRIHTAEK